MDACIEKTGRGTFVEQGSEKKPWVSPRLVALGLTKTSGGRFNVNFETQTWFNNCNQNPSLCS